MFPIQLLIWYLMLFGAYSGVKTGWRLLRCGISHGIFHGFLHFDVAFSMVFVGKRSTTLGFHWKRWENSPMFLRLLKFNPEDPWDTLLAVWKNVGTAEQVLETLRKSPKSQECFRKWSMNIYDIYVHGGFVILSLLVYWRAQGLKFAVHCRSFKSWQQWPGAPKGQKITKWAAVPIANVTNSHFEWKQSATATWGDDWEFP